MTLLPTPLEQINAGETGAVVRAKLNNNTDRITSAFVNTARFEDTVHNLCGTDDPAAITSAVLNAALAANPDVKQVKFLDRDYTLNAKITLTNRDMAFVGTGTAGTRLILPGGANSGVEWTQTTQTTADSYTLSASGMTLHATSAGVNGFNMASNLVPYSVHQHGYFNDLNFTVSSPSNFFDRCFKFKHAQGTQLRNIAARNFLSTVFGVGVEYTGFCLANSINWMNCAFMSHFVLGQPFEVRLISLTSASGTWVAGDTVTAPGGRTGIIAGVLVGTGATPTFLVEELAGSWTTTGITVTSSNGASGTLGSHQLREWGSEGFYISDIEAVGVQFGVRMLNGSKIAKPAVAVTVHNGHINASITPIALEFVDQATLTGFSLYGLVPTMDYISLTSCRRVSGFGSISNVTATAGGTGVRAIVGDPTYGTNALDRIDLRVDPFNLSNTSVIDAGGTLVTVDEWPGGQAKTWTPTLTAQTPGITPPTFGATTARYTTRGRYVDLSITIQITTAGTAANDLRFTLPLGTLKNWTTMQGVETTVSGKMVYARESPGASVFGVRNFDGTGVWANGATVVIDGTYERS